MLPYAWRLSISAARMALGLSCLALYVTSGGSPFSWGVGLFAAYLAYAAIITWRSMVSEGAPRIALLTDSAGFGLWLAFTGAAAFAGTAWQTISSAAYVFLLSTAVLYHRWPYVAGVALYGATLTFVLPTRPVWLFRPVAIWAGVLAIAAVIYKHHLENRLSRAARQSVLFRYEGQRAREEERQRIAADFHDGPLQSFISFQMRLEILRKMLSRDASAAMEELKQLQELCRAQVSELRAFVRSMRPADVDGAGLGASISRMVDQFQKDTGVAATFVSGDYIEPTETEVALEILQIVREALNNIQKHAKATRVSVAATRKGEQLEIAVDDNGAGFPFSGTYSLDELDLLRLGPVSIRRRVRALGGDLTLDSRPGQGSALKVRIGHI
jgi:signal transduction histidine kinase